MRKKLIHPDINVTDACKSLRDHVHEKPSGYVGSLKAGGVVIGYCRKTFLTFRRREVYVKVPGHRIDDLSKRERERILGAVMDVFVIEGAAIPQIGKIAPDCLLMVQDYIPDIPVERSPGLVSIAGGWEKQ